MTVVWSFGPPSDARAVTRHLYDVHASSGVDGTNDVSFTLLARSKLPVLVLMISIRYFQGPGCSVIAGLLQMNRGLVLKSTLLLAAQVPPPFNDMEERAHGRCR